MLGIALQSTTYIEQFNKEKRLDNQPVLVDRHIIWVWLILDNINTSNSPLVKWRSQKTAHAKLYQVFILKQQEPA